MSLPCRDALAIQIGTITIHVTILHAIAIALAHPTSLECCIPRFCRTCVRACHRASHQLDIPRDLIFGALAAFIAGAWIDMVQELDGVVSCSSTQLCHDLIDQISISCRYTVVLTCTPMVLKGR